MFNLSVSVSTMVFVCDCIAGALLAKFIEKHNHTIHPTLLDCKNTESKNIINIYQDQGKNWLTDLNNIITLM